MIDIGLNLTNTQFKNDIDEVISNALLSGVEAMIVTGTSIKQSQAAYQLVLEYPDFLYSTAGIHPHDAKSLTQHTIEHLAELLTQKHVVAVGECGLDFNRNFSTPAQQLSCFEMQLELAVELQVPVFLHQRDAHDDFLHLIRKYRAGLVDAVAHCFTNGQAELESYLEENMHIGITGWICDERRGKKLQDCAALIPDDKVLVETDAPYLFPRDLKLPQDDSVTGKKKKNSRCRNEPRYLAHIVKTLAQFMGKDEMELVRLSTENARRFFRL